MELASGLTLLLGGARSGKSDLAVRLGQSWTAARYGDCSSANTDEAVLFVATAEAFDDDMTNRIERHKLDRPSNWTTIEEPRFGAEEVAGLPGQPLLILDCLTLLTSNLLLAEQPIDRHVASLSQSLAGRPGPSIVVSNEVGMGIHPETDLGRRYRDELGRANRIVAATATTALFIVAGRAIPLQEITWAAASGASEPSTTLNTGSDDVR